MFINSIYLVSAICFILSLKGLASPKTAKRGNTYGIIGMSAAVIATLLSQDANFTYSIAAIVFGGIIGTSIALKIQMTSMPQLVAAFHSLVGIAATLTAFGTLIIEKGHEQSVQSLSSLIEMSLGSIIGTITFSGSVIAFAKLQGIMSGKPIILKQHKNLNILLAGALIFSTVLFVLWENTFLFFLMNVIALILGITLIIPIGGADMPVVVSMLNSYSGWAASGIGFVLSNNLLVITGALVGASGAILSYIMCHAMNRSIINIMFGVFSDSGPALEDSSSTDKLMKSGSTEDAAFMLKNASSVIIVPGYGMAVAQAQHAVKELIHFLTAEGVKVRFAIHPVAGRMPGHMNVLLAEAGIDYDMVFELEEINKDFATTDIAVVIGANDITNPAAKNDPNSPIYGMPILEVENAKTVFFIKRGTSSGYAGIENSLFYNSNTIMLFGDARHVVEEISKELPNV